MAQVASKPPEAREFTGAVGGSFCQDRILLPDGRAVLTSPPNFDLR